MPCSWGQYVLIKAVHIPLGVECHGLERNHMYYYRPTMLSANKTPHDALYSLTSNRDDRICMYYKKDLNVGDGIGRTGYCVMSWNDAMWLYPPDL